jgi:hypothetical protein
MSDAKTKPEPKTATGAADAPKTAAPKPAAPRTPGTFHRMTAGGTVRERRVGVEARLKAGDSTDSDSVTWNVALDAPPAAGDRLRDAHGTWWTVTAVGAAADGFFPCTCTKTKEG